MEYYRGFCWQETRLKYFSNCSNVSEIYLIEWQATLAVSLVVESTVRAVSFK